MDDSKTYLAKDEHIDVQFTSLPGNAVSLSIS